MKIEKLTENKIRVVVHIKELGLKTSNVHSIMTNAIQSENFFYDILEQAEKEVSFYTDGCKLLIETFSSLEDVIVFTITKYSYSSNKTKNNFKSSTKSKHIVVKRKSFTPNKKETIFNFESFDTFCEFCSSVKNFSNIDVNKILKNSILYLWKNNYYLVIKNLNVNSKHFGLFYSTLFEFGKLLSCSDNFSSKLAEHGKAIIRKNAINVGMKYFS